MSEKKPEEKQIRRAPYPQPYPVYPPPPPPPPPQYRPPPPPQQYPQVYQPPPPRQVTPPSRTVQQPRFEELTPSVSKIALYLGIPLALIAIIFIITVIVLFPTTNDAYVPYSSIAFMASLIAIAASLIVSFIAMYQIAIGLDKRFEYIIRSLRQQTTTAQTTIQQPAVPPPQYVPQYQQPTQERILAPPPRQAQVKPQQPSQQPQVAGEAETTEQQGGEEEGISEE
ncbi:MAG: hypothetical protein AT716_04920 [Vulcanisaeta sp. MG_3]|nr:MAG: hypothetical protein AT716_04920 [Vulcanisaeta sp. MG_3]